MHISDFTNLQYESLWQEIITSIKQIGRTKWRNKMKNIYAAFTIWNPKSTVTYKCGQVVLSRKSVYFDISHLILLFSFLLLYSYLLFTVIFMYNALHFQTFIFTLYVPCFPFSLIDNNWKWVLLIKRVIFFEPQKYYFALFNFLKKATFRRTLFWLWSALWNSTSKITTLF